MKTRELIDKYEVRQSTDTEYNPPSYIWIDNTGEIIRCKDCNYYECKRNGVNGWCNNFKVTRYVYEYCSDAERKEE